MISVVCTTSDPPSVGGWLDLAGLAIVLAFLVLGAVRGLWWQVVRLLGIVAAVSVARAAAPNLAGSLQSSLPGLGPQVAGAIAWLAILLAGFLAVALVGRIGRATLEAAHLSLVDRAGGAAAGAISGVVVHTVILLVLVQVSSPEWSDARIKGTRSGDLLVAVGRAVPRFLDVPVLAAAVDRGTARP